MPAFKPSLHVLHVFVRIHVNIPLRSIRFHEHIRLHND